MNTFVSGTRVAAYNVFPSVLGKATGEDVFAAVLVSWLLLGGGVWAGRSRG